MEYPHRRYIEFLISKKLEPFEVAADCAAHRLLPPNEADYMEIRRSVGIPPHWSASAHNAHKEFKKWLVDMDLYGLWMPDEDMESAKMFLFNRQRRDFESLMLLHGDVETVRNELLITYTEKSIPSLAALELYCFYFWDVGSMSKQGLFEFLEATTEKDDRAKLAAFSGEMVTTYATLGLRQKISTMDALDTSVQFWQMQIQMAMRTGALLGGQQLAGLAALQRTGFDALAMREELQKTTEESTLRREAAMFRAQITERQKPLKAIPSIDDLRGDVIDADESDEEEDEGEGDRVHRLPTRGRTS